MLEHEVDKRIAANGRQPRDPNRNHRLSIDEKLWAIWNRGFLVLLGK